jgi:tetratricopeptide (TPR) repeat protein
MFGILWAAQYGENRTLGKRLVQRCRARRQMIARDPAPATFAASMSLRAFVFLVFSALLALTGCSRPKRAASTNPELLTPVLAARTLEAKSLYFNANALQCLLQERPDLLKPEDRDANSERRRQFTQAVQDPKLFRRLDREWRFDTLWLVGDPSQFKPLLEHLMETKDFTLIGLDHTSLVFRRGDAPAWEITHLDSLRARFSLPSEQAVVLAQAATKLLAVRQLEPARHSLEQAEKLDAQAPEVWTGWSTFHMLSGKWASALEAADRALALDAEFLPAIACKTQILYSTKKFSDAYALSERLLATSPEDPGLLFYHAKLAHEAHAYQAEIRTLNHLIDLAERAGASVSGYRIYLGQAHAATSDADNALDQLSLALLDTELPREQRKFADELFNQIKDRVKPKSQ